MQFTGDVQTFCRILLPPPSGQIVWVIGDSLPSEC